ncbi:MAG TPA: nitrilase-related carbon-nitrogen hydrolase, partial [Bacillota bacterium]|nr:nitrilase-related carbon-nitrogen hydrolase [Bacillota bacterium]
MKHGYVRVGACTPHLSLANPKSNAETILKELLNADANEVSILCFPELSLTGYTCNDLFFQRELQQETLDSLFWLLDESKNIPILFAVGLPIAFDNKLYNCAALCLEGKLLGIVPKKNIPNYAEFYEARHFTAGEEIGTIRIRGNEYPFGTNLLFEAVNMDGLSIAAEICEDLWVPCPPSIAHAINGATVILNLSASDEIVTKSKYRRSLVST